MEKIIGIYKITSPKGKIYIGQSSDINYRVNVYKKLRCNGQTKLYRSLKKYGWEKHIFEIICQCTIEELNTLEKYYVDLFQTFNSEYGMNLKDGGGAKVKFSDESKAKISRSLKGRIMPDEWKMKISQGSKGRIFTKEHRDRIGAKHKGRIFSEETKNKMRAIMMGNKKFLGIKHSERTKAKISEANTSRIILNIQTGIYYLGAREAANSLNIKKTILYSMLNSQQRNTSPFIYA